MAPLQRAKQALTGCFHEASKLHCPKPLVPTVPYQHTHPRSSNPHPNVHHVQLISGTSASTLSPDRNHHPIRTDNDDDALLPPNTGGFLRRLSHDDEGDPDIPRSVECRVVTTGHPPSSSANILASTTAGTGGGLGLAPALQPSLSHHQFASILEGDDDEEEDEEGNDGVEPKVTDRDDRRVSRPQPRDSPVCLLFADEADQEPNFTVLLHQSQSQFLSQVVDESAYLAEHPSALLDEPSRLLHVSSSVLDGDHNPLLAGSGAVGTSFAAAPALPAEENGKDSGVPRHHDGPATDVLPESHATWLRHVLDVQRDARQSQNAESQQPKVPSRRNSNSIGSRPNSRGSSSIHTGPVTGAERDTNSAADATHIQIADDNKSSNHHHDERRLRQSVQEQVQRQIDAQLVESEPKRGRSAEPRANYTLHNSNHASDCGTVSRGRSWEVRPTQPDNPNKTTAASTTNAALPSKSRVGELRQHYSQPPLATMSQHPRAVEAAVVPTPILDGEESFAKRHRKLRETQKRSASLPPSPAVRNGRDGMAAAVVAPLPRRSSSVPPVRQQTSSQSASNDFPALLQLAGWRVPPPAATKPKLEKPADKRPSATAPPPLPALLQWTGWNNPTATMATAHSRPTKPQRLSEPARLRPVSHFGPPGGVGNRKPLRLSEPLPQPRHHRAVQPPASSAPSGFRPRTGPHSTLPRKSSATVAVQTSPVLALQKECLSTVPAVTSSQPSSSYRSHHLTIAHMLQQTYPLTSASSEDDEWDDLARTAPSRLSDYMKFTYVAPLPDDRDRTTPSSRGVVLNQASPAVSVASPDSHASAPMVSNQASANAAFLFSNTNDHNLAQQSRTWKRGDSELPSFTISTLDSLHRVSGLTTARTSASTASSRPKSTGRHSSLVSHPNESITDLPTRPSHSTAGSKEGNRHVRFTDSTKKREAFRSSIQVQSVSVPPISTKLSDLTDTNLLSSRSYDSVSSSSGAFEFVVESKPDDSNASPPFSAHGESKPSPVVPPPAVVPVMNWAYSSHGSQGNEGVTPFRKGSSSVSQATNSPFVRFKEARSKFSGAKDKDPPVKRSSPVKRKSPGSVRAVSSGLVHERIAAMEAARDRQPPTGTTTSAGPANRPLRVRRATTGHEAIAPRKPTLVSPYFRPRSVPSGQEVPGPLLPVLDALDTDHNSVGRTKSAVDIVLKANDRAAVNDIPMYRARTSTVSTATSVSEYGEIQPATVFDEDSDTETEDCASTVVQDRSATTVLVTASVHPQDEEEDEDDDDAFAAILNNNDNDSSSEEDDGDTMGEETVSTIRQEKVMFIPGVAKYSQPMSSGDSLSSSASTFSIIQQQRLSFLSSDCSATIASKETEILQFRDESLVRPNEQKPPRSLKGSLHLSPMQRTPMQARKWRALAQEAQANSKKKVSQVDKKSSLAERNPNVLYPTR